MQRQRLTNAVRCLRTAACIWVFLGIATVRTLAQTEHQPQLLFDISDESMPVPIGVILDIAVSDSTVYLLDRETSEVRRITLTGRVLPSVGRSGEGPGDLSHPLPMTFFRARRCVVVQTFSKHAVCLTPDGDECGMLDISALKEGYASTIWLRAAACPGNEIILASIDTLRPVTNPNEGFEASGRSASVRRLRLSDARIQTLFATDTKAQTGAVAIPPELFAFVVHGWDVSPNGRMVYADPMGAYRVTIGHPCDGNARVIDLPEWDGDAERVRALARRTGSDTDAVFPRIASVQWLNEAFFVVKPAANVPPTAEENSAGTYELFDASGSSYGRYHVRCGFDPANDQMYLRGDVLVVVRGGQAVARSVYRGVLSNSSMQETEATTELSEVRVQAYRILASVVPTSQ